MIDTHCHLLPGLDDGPRSQEASVELAAQLHDAGVREVVCTPHYSRRYPTAHADATARLLELREVLSARRIPLDLHLAAELSPAFALSEPTAALRARALGSRFCLIELQPDTPAIFLDSASERLRPIGLTPVFAHPERNTVVQRRPQVLDAHRRDGALVQVVASSITGRWGSSVARAAWQLLESGRADLLASDAHRAQSDGSPLAVALSLVSARLGAAAVKELTQTNPAAAIGSAP